MDHDSKAEEPIQAPFLSLLESGQFSDLKIRCKEDEYNVHKAIVCPQSDFFGTALNSVGGFKESKTNVIELHEADPAVVRAIVQFLYRSDYQMDPESDENRTVFHVSMYSAAEMYQIEGLKSKALRHFESRFSKFPDTSEPFAKIVEMVYSSTVDHDRSLRDHVARHVAQSFDEFRKSSELSTIAEDTPGFARDLSYALHDNYLQQLKVLDKLEGLEMTCPHCKRSQFMPIRDLLNNTMEWCGSCHKYKYAQAWTRY
ncbi:BTB/POZ protein [Phyllosticta citribraziliensis]